MSGNPDFLVLDEPANGLDPQGIIEMRELILKLNREQGITVLISSHILDELSRLATHYGFIDKGTILREISAVDLEAACRKCLCVTVSDVQTLCIVSSLLVCVATALVTLIAGIPLFGIPLYPSVMLQKFGIGILMVASFSGIFTFLSMLIHNKPVLSVVCIIGFFALLFISIYIMQRLEAPEFIESSFMMNVDGEIVQGDPFPNPAYLRGTARAVYEFFADFLPTSQSFRIVQSGALPHPWQLCFYSVLISVVSTLGGIFLFCKKDLK